MRYFRAETICNARFYRLKALTITACVLIAAILFTVSSAQQRTSPPQQQDDGESRPRRTEPPSSKQQSASPAPKLQLPTDNSSADDAPPIEQQPDPANGQDVGEDETIRVDTSVVNLNVRVIDRSNRPVSDIRQDELRIVEDGVPQTIAFFSKEEVPISYGLVIDNSGSLRSQIDKVIEAGKTIVSSNKSGDETFLVRFIDSDQIETVQDFTANKAALADALDDLYVQGGQTAVVDAVYLSAERVAEHKKGKGVDDRRRRALILITDGEDRNSYYRQEQLFARLREQDVQIFVIGFVNELDKEGGFIRKSPREKAVSLLERLAKETGGRVFFPNTLAELPTIADEITRDLRTQYVVGYSPTNKARDGSYRSVRVAVVDPPGRDKRIAVARPGYTAPRDGSSRTASPSSSSLPPTHSDRSRGVPTQPTTTNERRKNP